MEYEHSVDSAWREIRAKRHQPPGNAFANPRRLVFAAAMKQAEQFFRLSDVAGYETKPILLYYGLNQAARAIVAVAAASHDDWQLRGHGLWCPSLSNARTIGDVEVADKGSNKAFQALAKHVYSPTLPIKVNLRQLWVSLPEGLVVPLQNSDGLWSAALLQLDYDYQPANDDTHIDNPAVTRVLMHHMPSPEFWPDSDDESRQVFYERYPELRRFVLSESFKTNRTMRRHVSLLPNAERAIYYHDAMNCGADFYSNYRTSTTFVLPTVAGNTAPLEPIMTWWAILYALSMLARYEPSSWTKTLDIDSSPDAPAVEYLLDEAHRACVNLILYALTSAEQSAFWESDQG